MAIQNFRNPLLNRLLGLERGPVPSPPVAPAPPFRPTSPQLGIPPPPQGSLSSVDVIEGAGLGESFPSSVYGGAPVRGEMYPSLGGPGAVLDNRSVAALAGLKSQLPAAPASLTDLGGFQDIGPAGAGTYEIERYAKEFGPERAAEQERQKAVRGAITAQHPAIQAAAETEARRKAYPQTAYGQAQLSGAQAAAQSRLGVEASRAAQADEAEQMRMISSLFQSAASIQRKPNATDEDIARAQAMYDLALEALMGLYGGGEEEFEE